MKTSELKGGILMKEKSLPNMVAFFAPGRTREPLMLEHRSSHRSRGLAIKMEVISLTDRLCFYNLR